MLDAEHGMYTETYHKGECPFNHVFSHLQLTYERFRRVAFPEAKLYFPPGATKKWKSKGLISEGSTNVFTYEEGKPDPFEVDTAGEIKSADFTRAHLNEVRLPDLIVEVDAERHCSTGPRFLPRSHEDYDRSRSSHGSSPNRTGEPSSELLFLILYFCARL